MGGKPKGRIVTTKLQSSHKHTWRMQAPMALNLVKQGIKDWVARGDL